MNAHSSPSTAAEAIDILIVTAIKEEWDELLQVTDGAVGPWEPAIGPHNLQVARTRFRAKDGSVLRVLATWALEMGGVAASNAAGPLVERYHPRVLAMCGVCAGRRGKVNLGDVLVADRLWFYDVGKTTVEYPAGVERRVFEGSMHQYKLNPRWKQAAEGFEPDPLTPWLEQRPRTYAQQEDWLLAQVAASTDPAKSAEQESRCAQYDQVLERLWKDGRLVDSTLTLTEAGRAYINRLLLKHRDRLPPDVPLRVRVAPIGSGSQVMQHERIFDQLASSMREVLGLEMEAAALGAIAHQHEIAYVLVMKAVMDFADSAKNDNFKKFAARASAECLLAFLRAQLPSVGSDFTSILKPGTAPLPPARRPSVLLQARHRLVPFYRPGRAALWEELQRWSERPEPAVRLFYGPGGMGKTRLFIEWTEHLRQQGWRAGFLVEQPDSERLAALLDGGQDRLLVLDYAERRMDLLDLLQRVAERGAQRGRLHLALLARSAGEWWTELQRRDGSVADLLLRDEPTALPPLSSQETERAQVFAESAARFAAHLGKPEPREVPPLAHERFGRVLYLHMAALAAVEGLPVQADALIDTLLDHEQRSWALPGPAASQRRLVEQARGALVVVTLRGGVADQQEAEALLQVLHHERSDELLYRLHDGCTICTGRRGAI